MLDFVTWMADPAIFTIGAREIRWYGLAFAIGFAIGYWIVEQMWKKEQLPPAWIDSLLIYTMLGTVIGARLGHCLFYAPDYYLANPVEILKIWEGGLASHGGTLGLMIALVLYSRSQKINIMRVLDNVAIVTPICACAIRMGNLMNSEIIGRVTDVPWAFIFERVDMQPRHPGQLYEALCYACFFFVGWWFYKHKPERVGTGFFFGLCLVLIFTSRILIEYTKENQVGFEDGMLLNMGQLLSVPFVLLGLYCMMGGRLCRKLGEK